MSGREDIVVAEGAPLLGDGGTKRRMVLLSLGNLHRSILQMADGRWLVDTDPHDVDLGHGRWARTSYVTKDTEAGAVEAAKELLILGDARLRLGARWP